MAMGELIKELASCDLSSEFPYLRANRIESADCVHLHRRNFRILFTDKQFEEFHCDVCFAFANWLENGMGSGDGDGDVLCDTRIPDGPLSPIHLRIEENVDWVHIHLGEMRLMLSQKDFVLFSDAVDAARKKLVG